MLVVSFLVVNYLNRCVLQCNRLDRLAVLVVIRCSKSQLPCKVTGI